MLVTEDEAKQLFCGPALANPAHTFRPLCHGRRCMGWQVIYDGDRELGYCGHAGTPTATVVVTLKKAIADAQAALSGRTYIDPTFPH